MEIIEGNHTNYFTAVQSARVYSIVTAQSGVILSRCALCIGEGSAHGRQRDDSLPEKTAVQHDMLGSYKKKA